MLNIITITKNDLNGVENTIRSTKTLRDKYNVVQIIIDSSNLANRLALKHFLKKENNVVYYRSRVQGISNAFNYGILKSNQDWLWFLNGGDTIYEKVNYDLFNCVLNSVNSDLLIFEMIRNDEIVKHPPIIKMWPALGWVPHPATVIKRKCIKELGSFNKRYKVAMDGDLWMKIFSKDYVVDLISVPLVNFASGGISSNENVTGKEIAKLIWENKKLLFINWINGFFETCSKWIYYTVKIR